MNHVVSAVLNKVQADEDVETRHPEFQPKCSPVPIGIIPTGNLLCIHECGGDRSYLYIYSMYNYSMCIYSMYIYSMCVYSMYIYSVYLIQGFFCDGTRRYGIPAPFFPSK